MTRGLLNLKAESKITIKFYARLIGGYAILFGSILSFGLLFTKLVETIFILIGYFATRFVVPKIKHFDSTQKCISISTMTFLFAIAIVCVPKSTSLIWSVLVGGIIPLIMYVESLLFDVKISDNEKLIALCKLHGYNELKTQIAIKFFIDKERPKDVWLWLCTVEKYPMEWDSVKNLKYRMKKDLFG